MLNAALNLLLLVGQLLLVVAIEIVGGDAQHLEPLRSVLIPQLDQPRRLDLAWAAPCSPEVDQHRLAFVAGQRDLLATQVFECKCRSRFALERRKRIGLAARSGHQLALCHGGQRPLGRLLAEFPVGPTRPREDGQYEQNGRDNQGVALHGDSTSRLYCTGSTGCPAPPQAAKAVTIKNR